MNQRFQNEDIRRISDKYAKDELYKAISSIGMQLEAELTGFGLCPEECFMEAKEVLSCVVEIREDIQQSLNTLWLRKYNEYRRIERNAHIAVDEDETRKVVGIVFGFAILAADSSQDSFYRHTLSECLAYSVAMHEFNGWVETLSRISSVPLADGWFDRHVASALQVPNEEENLSATDDWGIIPQDCKEAVNKVIIPEFTIKGGIVLNSRKQIIKAAMKLNETSNIQVAMLMQICIEVKAVRPATNCHDFVRALIGIGSIIYSDKTAISRMAGGMTKKINGHKSNGKTYPPLDKNHLRWNSNDREIGKNIYENMISEED